MIERHPVRDTPTTVMPGDAELPETKRRHQAHAVDCHRALRGLRMVGQVRGRRALAVPTQVCRHDREPPRQARGYGVPHRMCLWMAVEQEQRRPGTPVAHTQDRLADVYSLQDEPREQRRGQRIRVHGRRVMGPGPSRPDPDKVVTSPAVEATLRLSDVEMLPGAEGSAIRT